MAATNLFTAEEKLQHITVTQAVDLDAQDTKLDLITVTQAVDLDAVETKANHITVTQAVDLDAIESRVNDLDASIILRGEWDASSGTFPGSGSAQSGDSYIVSTAGTVDSVVFAADDRIIAVVDNASTSTFAANWHKADYTDLVQSVAGRTGAVTLTSSDLTDTTAFARTILDDADASTALSTLGVTAFAKTLLDDADASTALSSLGVTTFAKSVLDDATADAALSTLGVTTFAKSLLDDTDASDALSTLGVTAFAKTILDDADAAAVRDTLDITEGGGIVGDNEQSGLSYTLVLSDKNKRIRMTNSEPNTVEIPPNSSVAYDINSRIEVTQWGLGQVTISAGSGVVVRYMANARKTSGQYGVIVLDKIGLNEWLAWGDTSSTTLVPSGSSFLNSYSSDGQGLVGYFATENGSVPNFKISDAGTPANDVHVGIGDLSGFSDVLTYTSPKIVRQVYGDLKYSAHNLYLNSAAPANQSITVKSGLSYKITLTGSVAMTLSGAATGSISAGSTTFTASTTTLTTTSTTGAGTVHLHETPADETYLPTTGTARYALPIEYDTNGDAIGMLVEPEATNLALRSKEFDNATWVKGVHASITANTDVSPIGVADADKLTIVAGASGLIRQDVFGFGTVTGNFSVYVKQPASGAATHVRITTNNGSAWNTGLSSKIALTSSWQQVSLSGTLITSGTTVRMILGAIDASGTADADCVGDVLIWCAELKTGPVAGSPIITAASTVTRAKDQPTKPLSEFANSFVEGTAFCDMTLLSLPTGTNRIFGVGSTGTYIQLNGGDLEATDGTNTLTLVSGAVAGTAYKIALSYESSTMQASVNGGAVVSTTFDGTYGSGSTLYLKEDDDIHMLLRSLAVIPSPNSGANLQAMTS